MSNKKYHLQLLIGAAFVTLSTTTFAYMPANVEFECKTIQMSFFVNGKQTSNSEPKDVKSVFVFYDGKQVSAHYKFTDAPEVAFNGAKFVSQNTKQDSGRTFDVTEFEKSANGITSKLQLVKELGGKKEGKLMLIDYYSNNGFASYGSNLSVCFNK